MPDFIFEKLSKLQLNLWKASYREKYGTALNSWGDYCPPVHPRSATRLCFYLILLLAMEEFCKRLNISIPPLITLRHAMLVTSFRSQQDSLTISELPWYMLSRIIILDSNSRLCPKTLIARKEVIETKSTLDLFKPHKIEETPSTSSVHPMDIFIFIFIRSHPIFLQTLIAQISKCQLSLPLITGLNPMLHIFVLRTLYKDYRAADSVSKSYSVVNEKIPFISFVRIGECSRSRKSQILNQIIGITNYFFHRDQLGSTKARYFLNGTVEIGWLFPQVNDNMSSDNTPVYSILNMRGNALNYNKQRFYLTTVSTLIYVFVPCNQLSVVYDDLAIYHKEFGSKSVYLLYEGDSLPIQSQLDEIKTPNFLSELCDTVLFREDNLAEVSDTITNNIVKRMQFIERMHLSLTDSISIARKLCISVDIDEHNISFCDSVVDNIMGVMYKSLSSNPNDTSNMPLAELKKTLLPLQNKGWAEWAETKRDANNFDLQNSTDFSNFKILINTKMKEARLKQIIQLENPSLLLRKIMNHCRTYGTLNEEFYIIWISLQNEFNSLCKQYLPPLYEEYKRWHKLSCSSESEAVGSKYLSSEDMNSCRYSLIQAGRNIAESSLGIEHIFRELGQVFEAYKDLTDNSIKDNLTDLFKFKIEHLADIAAKLLFEGHAFEIMDGDVSHVPITWVMSVLRSLDLTIGPDKRIFVLSILGTQSSGKSTLLNTMFGANFPVSSGRCTRGIFMQLVPIDEKLCSQFRYDYLVLLDTEGLRAPDFSINYSYKRDNELATFAVGLGDMTIINMFGEGHSEIQDILQIIVFALIRMNEISYKPRCVFVHQNVPDTHAHTNLVAARSNLIKTLDQMTISAARQENKSALYTKFFQVIEFEPEREVLYFPGLFEGEPPLHQIAPGYSKAAIKLYTYILNCYSDNQERSFQTVKEWSKKLKTLWKSVLKENFVFSYRNALEVTTRIELDHSLSSWYSRYIYKINDWKSISINALLNASPDELDDTLDTLIRDLRREQVSPSIQVELEKKIMNHFFVKHEHVAILTQWKASTAFYFSLKRDKLIKELEEQYKMVYTIQKNKKEVDQKFNNFRKGIVNSGLII